MPVNRETFEFLTNYAKLKLGDLGKRTLISPTKIFLGLLKDDESLEICVQDKDIKTEVGKVVTDIWRPFPKKEEDIKTKRKVTEIFPDLIDLLNKTSYQHTITDFFPSSQTERSLKEDLMKIFKELDSKFQTAKTKMREGWEDTANPYLTAFIADNWQSGTLFQIGAKTASSVETTWGKWIEKAIFIYNPDLFYIAAGGMDFIKGTTAYDVKAGPQVMNKDQVAEAKKKNRVLTEEIKDNVVNEVIGLTEFKVAISYGRREIAWPFMEEAEELIIYGPETWATLTGDEWNAFRLFLNCIEYKHRSKSKWSKEDLESAVKNFVNSFYGGIPEKFEAAVSHPSYLSLIENYFIRG